MAAAGGCIISAQAEHHVCPKDKYIIFIIKLCIGCVNYIRLDSKPTELIE